VRDADKRADVVSTAPFFIVGSGRSGTTLLRVILASHSRISIPPETWYLNRLQEFLELKRPLLPDEVERVAQIMTNHYRWPDMDIDANEFRFEVSQIRTPYLRDVAEVVYRKHVERDHKSRWGDKTPGYIAILPQLADIFPEAKFIHFIRDGRDVAKSFQLRQWYGPWLHENTREWIESMDFNERWSRTELSSRIFQASYENLVLDTEKSVREICDFLGEQFEPQMLSWQRQVDNLVPAREAHIHSNLKQEPDASNIARWKREMTLREVFVAEAFMGRHLKSLGYELKFSSAAWSPLFAIARWYCREVWPRLNYPVRAVRRLRRALARSEMPLRKIDRP